MSDVRDAGRELRRLREERHLTQRDVERLTGGRVLAQQVSRLETGALSKPPMEDLVILGGLYGLTPTQVAELYGYGAIPAQPESPSELQWWMADEEALERAIAASSEEQRRAELVAEPRARMQMQEPREHRVSESRVEHPLSEEGQSAPQREQPSRENLEYTLRTLVDMASDLPDPLQQKLNNWLELLIMILGDEMGSFGSHPLIKQNS